jgi:hypothetical protein
MDWADDDDMALKRSEKIWILNWMLVFDLRFRISGGSGDLFQPTPKTINALMSPRTVTMALLFLQE